MKTENTQPLDSHLQQGVNEGLREKLEVANKSMTEIKILNNTTRDLVSKDVNDLLMTENQTEINDALIVIGHKSKIQPIYRKGLQESTPEIAKEAAEALNKYQRSLINEDRKASERQPVVESREFQENTSQKSVASQRDIQARKAIEQTNYGLMPVPTNALDKETARDVVRDDIAAFSKIENKTERQLAAVAIGHSAKGQIAYQAELQLQNPDIAKEAATKFAENLHRNNESKENIITLNERTQESTNHKAADLSTTVQDKDFQTIVSEIRQQQLQMNRSFESTSTLSQASVKLSDRSPAYGIMQIDDKPITSIRFERNEGEQLFNVSYHMGKTVMKLKSLDVDTLADAVGSQNAKAIIEHSEAKGLLKGETLINEYGISPEEKVRRINDANKLEVIDSKEAIAYANQHRKREQKQLGLNIEGKQINEQETSRRTNNHQENIIAFNDRTQEKPVTSNQPVTEQTDEKQTGSTTKQAINQDMPETVSNRYLRIKDKYYFQDKTMAFEDRGTKLKLETENHTVIKDALVIAETRNWQSITVSGSDNFKHQVWREATLKGIDVSGYKPTQFEEAELNQALALRDVRKEIVNDPKLKNENVQQQNNGIRGVLLAHGADHYKHDPKNGQSYYVTLNIDNKEVTHWGADFKRAFSDSYSQPQVGNTVILSNEGQQNVEITAKTQDAEGNLVDDKKSVKKNTWRVEKADYHDSLQDQTEALRVGKEIEHRVIEQMPQLAAALAVSKLGEKIAQQAKESGALKSQDEVDTMVSLIREGLAAALKNGKHIKIPEIQEQGKHAAIEANNILNDQKPPEIVKEPQQQDMAMTR